MDSVKKYRRLIGTFEIIVGSFLILPVVMVAVFNIILGNFPDFYTSSVYVSQMFGWYAIDPNNYSINPLSGQTLIIGFLFIGLVILVNGIWKIRSNRYLKDVTL